MSFLGQILVLTDFTCVLANQLGRPSIDVSSSVSAKGGHLACRYRHDCSSAIRFARTAGDVESQRLFLGRWQTVPAGEQVETFQQVRPQELQMKVPVLEAAKSEKVGAALSVWPAVADSRAKRPVVLSGMPLPSSR